MITLYGIKNCDSVKKAKKFLAENNVQYNFIDFREQPLSVELLQYFINTCGLEKLINTRSKTYRELAENQRNNITTDIILANITLIKRPVMRVGDDIIIGFDANKYREILV